MEHLGFIYKNYSGKVYNLAYRMTGNQQYAEDITQETFISVFNKIDTFRGESQLYTWIYRIAKNTILRYIKNATKISFSSLEELQKEVASPVTDKITEEEKSAYILQVKEGCLTGLIRCLSFNQRIVFILNVLLNLPVSEVAKIIEKSENATRLLAHRSRQNIKDFLCKNCSLYDVDNTCQCQNMINFSLKEGWIGDNSSSRNGDMLPQHEIRHLESEIGTLKKVITLYKQLPNKAVSKNLSHTLKKRIKEKKEFLIFSPRKVK
ncbi:MAG: RNA polymerase sigma factor [Melioribacteraceae bacterium]|nr:RNA polymerase sigma factor [Melioribacteraceae bacterium]